MKILAFDSSNKALSVAILENDNVLAETLINVQKNHSVSLMPTIDFLMESVGLLPEDLDRIVVAQGPGSYTGLRVAVATAKMLAYSLGIELVGVSSLISLGASVKTDSLVIPLINARRNHVYAGFYKDQNTEIVEGYFSIETVLEEVKNEKNLMFVGEVEDFREIILEKLPQSKIQNTFPSAVEIGKIGAKLSPVDVDSFVPHYLKRVEAEEVWLQNHDEEDGKQYIKRV